MVALKQTPHPAEGQNGSTKSESALTWCGGSILLLLTKAIDSHEFKSHLGEGPWYISKDGRATDIGKRSSLRLTYRGGDLGADDGWDSTQID